jgi:hypothetical protein
LAALLAAAPAFAQSGINLSWSRCWGEGSGASNLAFACDSNDGVNVLVLSFILSSDLAQVTGNEMVLDLMSEVDPLPAWWDLRNIGSCRQTSLTFDTQANPADAVCVDWAAGQSVGGTGAYSFESGHYIDPNNISRHRRIKAVLAVPGNAPHDLVSATEYFSCNLTIDNAKSVGTGSCAGCAEPVCIVFNSLRVTTPFGPNDAFLGNASTPGSNMVTWQAAGPATCLAVPVRRSTWGSLKRRYY